MLGEWFVQPVGQQFRHGEQRVAVGHRNRGYSGSGYIFAAVFHGEREHGKRCWSAGADHASGERPDPGDLYSANEQRAQHATELKPTIQRDVQQFEQLKPDSGQRGHGKRESGANGDRICRQHREWY